MKNWYSLIHFLAFFVLCGTVGLQAQIATIADSDLKAGFGWEFSDLFEEVETFEPASFIMHIGTSLASDIELGETADYLTTEIPGVHLSVEKCILKNVGIGLKLGTHWWKAEKLNYGYRYYSVGLRATYHLNVHEKVDPYFGINLTGRGLWIGNGERNVNNITVKNGALIGGRYYLGERFALFGEYAEDGIGKVHFGITLKLK